MTCPHCETTESKVMDSGLVRDSVGERRYRRRLCKKCKGRFTTYEFVEPFPQKYNRLLVAKVERSDAPEPKKSDPRKEPSDDWLKRILKKLDETETNEKIIRGEL